MNRYAVIDPTNRVENIAAWDGQTPWVLASGWSAVASATADIGDAYNPTTGTFTSPPVSIPVPQAVSAFQAKAALTNADLYTQADTAIANSGDPILQLAWKAATEFQRQSPSIAKMAAALNLTSAQVDALFIAADQIVA